MRKNIFRVIIVSALLFAGIVFSAFDDDNDFEISKNLDIYYTLFKELNLYYVDDIDPGELVKTSIDKMLESLDPYTNYYPESKIEDYKFMTTGQYGGVGAIIRQKEDYVVVAEIYEGFPAHKSGLKVGDEIVEIAGKDTKGKNTEQISEMMKGQPGTTFQIKIRRFGSSDIMTKDITREKIQIKSVPYYGMLDDEIGYLILTSFTDKSGDDVKNAYLDLKKQGAQKVVFDLRGNPGGLLHEAVKIANIFVPQGQEIVSTKGKYKKYDSFYATPGKAVDTVMPIVVIVNRGSASASEIVSGAIQDLDRGVVIGQRTFGKGLVQSTRELSYNSKLKVTTAKYYIPSGRCIQALDYSHRNEDGSVGKVPDSLISPFKTKGGRTVYDGGGVQPDVVLKQDEVSDYLIQLMSEDILFEFANQFCLRNDSIDIPAKFQISDAELDSLKAYIDRKGVKFKSETEKNADKLEKIAKEEQYLDAIQDQLAAIREKLDSEKEKEFDRNKKEIADILKAELVSRYYFQRGSIESQLVDDPEVEEAVALLKDSDRYFKILKGEEGTHKNN